MSDSYWSKKVVPNSIPMEAEGGQAGMVAICRASESLTEHCGLALAECYHIGEGLGLPNLGAREAGLSGN